MYLLACQVFASRPQFVRLTGAKSQRHNLSSSDTARPTVRSANIRVTIFLESDIVLNVRFARDSGRMSDVLGRPCRAISGLGAPLRAHGATHCSAAKRRTRHFKAGASTGCRLRRTSALETLEELDHSAVDRFRSLLLRPVTATRQHDRLL